MLENENMNLNQCVMEFTDSLLNQWMHQFDNPPEFPFSFHVDSDGRLCLANYAICLVDEIDLTSGEIDVEEFAFYTYSGDSYIFRVDWPYNAPIRTVQVYKSRRFLFACEQKGAI